MKNFIFLFFLVQSTFVFGKSLDPFPRNECVYKTYSANAKVIQIHQTSNSINQVNSTAGYEGYEILFKITTNETITEEFAKDTLNSSFLFLLNNGWYPGSQYINKYGIKEYQSYSGTLRIRTSGNCDKNITFEIKEFQGDDYFEKPPVKYYPRYRCYPYHYYYYDDDYYYYRHYPHHCYYE